MKEKAWKNKKGSALLIAIVIMMAVMMLSLALLLVSYSLFATANKQQHVEQCKELAQSLCKELEAELTIQPFANYTEQKEALDAGKYPLWFYLRYNIWQSSWPYYNAEERGHTATYAYRYFDIALGDEAVNAVDDISVLMYWESESDAEEAGTPLVVQVTCKKGRQQSTITSTYELVIGSTDYADAPMDLETGPESVNPNRNMIDARKVWAWSLSARE